MDEIKLWPYLYKLKPKLDIIEEVICQTLLGDKDLVRKNSVNKHDSIDLVSSY